MRAEHHDETHTYLPSSLLPRNIPRAAGINGVLAVVNTDVAIGGSLSSNPSSLILTLITVRHPLVFAWLAHIFVTDFTYQLESVHRFYRPHLAFLVLCGFCFVSLPKGTSYNPCY